MNYTTAALLVNDNIRPILATYEVDTEHKTAPRVMYKTLDKSIKVGDLVIVPSSTRHKFTTVKVVEVDVDVDFKSSTKVDWVAARIDLENYALIHSEEEKMIEAIKASQKLKAKAELRKDMLDLHADVIGNLQITNMGSAPSISAA